MGRSRLAEWRWQSDLCGCAPSCERARAPRKCDKDTTKMRIGYRYSTGKKTPGGAGAHTGHTGHTGARGTVPEQRRSKRAWRHRPAGGRPTDIFTIVEPFPAHEVPTDPRARAPHERQRACAACSTKISPANHKALGRVRVVLAPGRRRELRPQGQLGG